MVVEDGVIASVVERDDGDLAGVFFGDVICEIEVGGLGQGADGVAAEDFEEVAADGAGRMKKHWRVNSRPTQRESTSE